MDHELLITIILISMISTIILYHLLIVIKRKFDKNDKYSIYLILYCLGIILYILFCDSSPLHEFLENKVLFTVLRPLSGGILVLSGVSSVTCLLNMPLNERKKFKTPFLISILIFLLSISPIFLGINFYNKYFRLLNAFTAAVVTVISLSIHINFVIKTKKKLNYNNKKEIKLFNHLIIKLLFLFIPSAFIVIVYSQLCFLFKIKSVGISNIALSITALMFAHFYSDKFTNEYKELQLLKDTLEQKVKDRTKKLSQLSERRKVFVINLAHEIKTPLTLITNLFKIALNELKLYEIDSKIINKLDISYKNILRILNFMTIFLNVDKLDGGGYLYTHNKIICFSEVLNDFVELYKTNQNKNINFISNIENDVYIKIDPLALERIINNLLENAIKYTEKGLIEINLYIKNNKIEFVVKDTGIGIAKENIESIFIPYKQLINEKKQYQGMGLGLSILKKTVNNLKGQIQVKSELGKGSEFTIVLDNYILKDNDIIFKKPISDIYAFMPETNYIDKYLKKENNFDKNKNTILLVEDNIEMISFLQHSFLNYNFYHALNGEEALKLLNVIHKPDIVISDIMMDVMDGYEFIQKIKSNNEFKNIPFIFLSAKEIDKNIGLLLGAVDYIIKPFDIYELIIKINNIINNKRNIIEENDIEKEKKIINYLKSKNITKKQIEIIQLILNGKENKDISSLLNISINTIKAHIYRIYTKLNVINRIELINKIENDINQPIVL